MSDKTCESCVYNGLCRIQYQADRPVMRESPVWKNCSYYLDTKNNQLSNQLTIAAINGLLGVIEDIRKFAPKELEEKSGIYWDGEIEQSELLRDSLLNTNK